MQIFPPIVTTCHQSHLNSNFNTPRKRGTYMNICSVRLCRGEHLKRAMGAVKLTPSAKQLSLHRQSCPAWIATRSANAGLTIDPPLVQLPFGDGRSPIHFWSY